MGAQHVKTVKIASIVRAAAHVGNVKNEHMRWIFLLTLCLNISNAQIMKCIDVHDGDSITVLATDNTKIKVRLEGIDAPEVKQEFGKQSHEALSNLVKGKLVNIKETTKDQFARTVAWVSVENTSVNREMLRLGMAWQFRKYNKDADLTKIEAAAREAKIGLWKQEKPVAPWDFRKLQKLKTANSVK